VRIDLAQAGDVIVRGAFERRIGVLADVDAEHAAIHGAPDVVHQAVHAAVVEAQAVDHSVRGGQAEQARARIAGLRARRHGADLDEAEAEAGQRIDIIAVLVEAGGEPYRVRKTQSHHVARAGGGRSRRGGREAQPGEDGKGLEREMVRLLRVESEQQRAQQRVHGAILREWKSVSSERELP
jgi:hypothetical protein